MKTKYDVALYVANAIGRSGRSNKEIAADVGFESANMISMLKSGETKVPLARIPELARAMGVDPHELLDLCLEAYQPELHGVLARLAPSMLVSERELKVVRSIRALTASTALP